MNQKKLYYAFVSEKFAKLISSNQQNHDNTDKSINNTKKRSKSYGCIRCVKNKPMHHIYRRLDKSGKKIDNVKCHAVFAYNNYESVEEITRNYFTYDDSEYVGIVDKWIKSVN